MSMNARESKGLAMVKQWLTQAMPAYTIATSNPTA
jgi:hypothetical protein